MNKETEDRRYDGQQQQNLLHFKFDYVKRKRN